MMSAQLQAVHIGQVHLATNGVNQRQQWPSNGVGMGGVGRPEGLAQMKNFTPLTPGINFMPTCGNVEQRVGSDQQSPNPHCAFKPTIAGRLSSGGMASPQKSSYHQFGHPQQGQHSQITQPLAGHMTNDFSTAYQPPNTMEMLQQQQQQQHQPQRITFASASNVSILTPPSSNPQSNGSIESGGLQLAHDFKGKNMLHMSTAEYELENWGAAGDLTTVQTTDEFDSFFGINHNGVSVGRDRIILNLTATNFSLIWRAPRPKCWCRGFFKIEDVWQGIARWQAFGQTKTFLESLGTYHPIFSPAYPGCSCFCNDI